MKKKEKSNKGKEIQLLNSGDLSVETWNHKLRNKNVRLLRKAENLRLNSHVSQLDESRLELK